MNIYHVLEAICLYHFNLHVLVIILIIIIIIQITDNDGNNGDRMCTDNTCPHEMFW